MPREGGVTPRGDGGEGGLVIQRAAVDGGRDMIFHGWRKSWKRQRQSLAEIERLYSAAQVTFR